MYSNISSRSIAPTDQQSAVVRRWAGSALRRAPGIQRSMWMLFGSPTHARLSDDRRNIAPRTTGRLRCLFGFHPTIAPESRECLLKVRIEARDISKRRIENRFHVTSRRCRRLIETASPGCYFAATGGYPDSHANRVLHTRPCGSVQKTYGYPNREEPSHAASSPVGGLRCSTRKRCPSRWCGPAWCSAQATAGCTRYSGPIAPTGMHVTGGSGDTPISLVVVADLVKCPLLVAERGDRLVSS